MSDIDERLEEEIIHASRKSFDSQEAGMNANFLMELQSEIERLRSDLATVTAERDALLARLAPVEDEELVEIAAYYFTDGSSWSALSERLRNICRRDARNVIAAIRPHIEAAERERCAAALEITSDEIRLHAGEMTAQEMRSVLAVLAWRAAAIRSGK